VDLFLAIFFFLELDFAVLDFFVRGEAVGEEILFVEVLLSRRSVSECY